MVWYTNKRPVEFERYRRAPFLLGKHYGWFFHVGEHERVNVTTGMLSKLLKEEKAYLVIDKDVWEKLVSQYRGEKTEQQKRLAEIKEKARREAEAKRRLAEEAEKKRRELERIKKQAEDRNAALERLKREAEKQQRKAN